MPAPRLLTDEQLARYLGDIPVAEAQRTAVGRVKWGRHTRWDVQAINAYLDALSDLTPDSPAAHDEAQLKSQADAALDRFFGPR